MRRAKLVIFDCDGVLIDSETISNEVLAVVVTELGWPVTVAESLEQFKGRSMPDVWSKVADEVGPIDSAAVDRDFRSRQLAALKIQVKAVPGVHETLAALRLPYCVASNGPHEKMRVTLGAAGLWALFDGRIYSRVDVPRAKPFPDLFLHAADAQGVAPADCVVVEDSPLGIEAALRAGMTPIGFAGTPTASAAKLRAAGAKTVLDELQELLPLLAEQP